ncbi:MAG TPA: hypothetical protein VHB02_06210 [Acidimicrobiales bacterium]|nr:hypothetical protein [Acidimicrobiales bacterium]
MTTLTPEEAVHRVKTALAEMGFGHLEVQPHALKLGVVVIVGGDEIPDAVQWTVASVVFGDEIPCWSCWLEGDRVYPSASATACVAGDCSHPEGPARPPRELLGGAPR